MRKRRTIVAASAALFLGFQVAGAWPAAADDSPVLIADADKVTLTVKDGGGATASVTLENQGPSDVEVKVNEGSGAADNCAITPPDDATLKAHRQQKMTFTFSEACDPERKEGTDFTVIAGESEFDLHADPPTKPDPNWGFVFLAFLAAAVVSAIVLAVSWIRWKEPVSRAGSKTFRMALPGLDASWKFSDSWAANATVVTAVFAGIFGAKDVTTALLGDGATDLMAVALVSAAAAVGLVGVSPMVLQGLRQRLGPEGAKTEGGKPLSKDMAEGLYVTPRALIFAAFFTLTGTIGQLVALLYALIETDFGDDMWMGVVGLGAAALIVWYAYEATDQNLTTGATLAPPDEKPTETVTTLLRMPAEVDTAGRALVPQEGEVVAVVVSPTATLATAERRSAGIL